MAMKHDLNPQLINPNLGRQKSQTMFLSWTSKIDVFVAKILKYDIFVAKICKKALIDSFLRIVAVKLSWYAEMSCITVGAACRTFSDLLVTSLWEKIVAEVLVKDLTQLT